MTKMYINNKNEVQVTVGVGNLKEEREQDDQGRKVIPIKADTETMMKILREVIIEASKNEEYDKLDETLDQYWIYAFYKKLGINSNPLIKNLDGEIEGIDKEKITVVFEE